MLGEAGAGRGPLCPGEPRSQGNDRRSRDELKANPPDVVIITTQWRAADIVMEMRREGIAAKQILLEHQGRLIDFWHDPHPYPLPPM